MASETIAVEDRVFDFAQSLGSKESESLCAICFEKHPFVDLPCSCKIDYCESCWHHALASSVTTRGQAQCPSCRSRFDVDFNQDDATLVFSLTEKGMSIADWRSRLYDKTRPVQIKLLQDFASRAGAAMEGEPPDSPRDSLRHEAICICGGVLEKVSTRNRIIRMLEDTTPGWRTRISEVDHRIDQMASKSLITCDLCDDIATHTGFVWTCSNGPNTVLHPAAYDVCESCFSRYTSCSGPSSNTSAACSSQASRRCNPFAKVSLPEQRRSSQTSAANGGSTPQSASGPAPGSTRTVTRSGNAWKKNFNLQARLRQAKVTFRGFLA